jgi:hypothetical protein
MESCLDPKLDLCEDTFRQKWIEFRQKTGNETKHGIGFLKQKIEKKLSLTMAPVSFILLTMVLESINDSHLKSCL